MDLSALPTPNLSVLVAEVSICDRKGKCISILVIYATSKSYLTIIDENDARLHGEEAVQIEESGSYEYEVVGYPSGAFLPKTDVIVPSSIGGDTLRGRLMPGLGCGLLIVPLHDFNGVVLGTAKLEVTTAKLRYRTEYRGMVDSIVRRSLDLLLDMQSSTMVHLAVSNNTNVTSIQQRIAFLRNLLENRTFHEAITYILSHPNQRLEQTYLVQDSRRAIRGSSALAAQIASRYPRVGVPIDHFLRQPRGARCEITSIPKTVTTKKSRVSINTPENKFVKHVLSTFSSTLRHAALVVRGRLEQAGTASQRRLLDDIGRLIGNLESVLGQPQFREITELTHLGLASPVLQRAHGYRYILQTWLQFQMASMLVWSASDGAFGAGRKDLAVLYEYWLYFELIDVVCRVFQITPPGSRELFEQHDNGIGLKLKSGTMLSVERTDSTGRKLCIEFAYNRTFSKTSGWRTAGSWTRAMRPDFTLSIWPASIHQDQAEALGLITHIHFDAKYRVDRAVDLFGSKDDDTSESDSGLIKGVPRRADLLKMHAYRDAIRRTEGAYVLYPGTDVETMAGYSEVLPGLGAFPIRPGVNGEAEGIERIAEFLQAVRDHVGNRASQRERVSYFQWHTHEHVEINNIKSQLLELTQSGGRATHPSDQIVLFVSIDNVNSCFIQDDKYVALRVDSELGKSHWRLDTRIATAEYIAVYSHNNHEDIVLWKIVDCPIVTSNVNMWLQAHSVTYGLERPGMWLIYEVIRSNIRISKKKKEMSISSRKIQEEYIMYNEHALITMPMSSALSGEVQLD